MAEGKIQKTTDDMPDAVRCPFCNGTAELFTQSENFAESGSGLADEEVIEVIGDYVCDNCGEEFEAVETYEVVQSYVKYPGIEYRDIDGSEIERKKSFNRKPKSKPKVKSRSVKVKPKSKPVKKKVVKPKSKPKARRK